MAGRAVRISPDSVTHPGIDVTGHALQVWATLIMGLNAWKATLMLYGPNADIAGYTFAAIMLGWFAYCMLAGKPTRK